MKKRKTVAYDIDDTLTTTTHLLNLASEFSGKECKAEEQAYYDVAKSFGWSKEQSQAFWGGEYHDRLVDGQEVTPVLNELLETFSPKSENAIIYIITARFERNRKGTEKWLADNGIEYDRLIMTNGESKTQYIEMLQIDTFVDDKGVFFNEVKEHGLDTVCELVLIDKPYNKTDFCHKRFDPVTAQVV